MYELVDSGHGQKLERFGDISIIRPCTQAVWAPAKKKWSADATFTREKGWEGNLPPEWTIELRGIKFRLAPTDFGHLGLFPEHQAIWDLLEGQSLLNLFAYSGSASLAAAKKNMSVCHVDSSHGMVDWARQNAQQNNLNGIRWIVDDAVKFCLREVKRGRQYDAILLDPPTFGRGPKGEVFKIEEQILPLLQHCFALKPKLLILSCHTPGWTPLILERLLPKGQIDSGELLLKDVPSGAYARWRP